VILRSQYATSGPMKTRWPSLDFSPDFVARGRNPWCGKERAPKRPDPHGGFPVFGDTLRIFSGCATQSISNPQRPQRGLRFRSRNLVRNPG
jgi:hypothetical protein